ncbi:MAG: phosphate ABC transporter permease PstA [Chloroflexi bacterium]|jgi:phosphate transport system permease protein|nr:phosphate ABC transporter permease PstA [Dehalococcoidia bacterium]MCO5200899.1 phosphate ABC transporter permease PstA [Chloroflexota bacterium]NJD66409.1 phosphate ABC transporter permease PstA [Chloroflexota bacterium]PWB46929.1 MAG: phosphate ABC transporter, permease protein PstA [Dehalococcoidia bacterium]
MAAPPAAGAEFSLKATGQVARRQALSRFSRYVLLSATLFAVAVLVYLAYDVIQTGWSRITLDFFTNYPSRHPLQAGLRSSLLGWLWLMGAVIAMAIPLAVGTAIFIEEFAPRNWVTSLVRLNIANLAGVPSIIYGILGLAVFVRGFDIWGVTIIPALGPTILAGALTLTLMILPMTVIASVEAIRQVPPSIRDGSLALGATRWQTVWFHVLPGATPGIMTGIILAVARAAGETAALIMIGAFAFIAFDNTALNQSFTTVPIQIYNWTTLPQEDFRKNAAAGIIVLMVLIVGLNLIAVLIRERFRRT